MAVLNSHQPPKLQSTLLNQHNSKVLTLFIARAGQTKMFDKAVVLTLLNVVGNLTVLICENQDFTTEIVEQYVLFPAGMQGCNFSKPCVCTWSRQGLGLNTR